MSMIRGIWSPWRNEKGATAAKPKWCHGNIIENGATATYPKMVPRQHIGSGSSRRYWCKRRRADACMDGGVIPDSGCPTGRRHGKRGGTCTKQTGTMQTYGTSQTTCIRSTTVVSGYTFEVFKRDGSHSERCRGSRRSQDVDGSSCTRRR